MHEGPSASETKRSVLRTLLVDGIQPVKLVLNPARLGRDHGIPARVLAAYTDGIPLDLDPHWPLELDLDAEPGALGVSLSFGGEVCRCRIPWRAVAVIAVGVGGVPWQHDRDDEPARPRRLPRRPDTPGPTAGHLRVLK